MKAPPVSTAYKADKRTQAALQAQFDQWDQAALDAETAVASHLTTRGETAHTINAMRFLITSDVVYRMKNAAKGHAWAKAALDPAGYIAQRIVALSDSKKYSEIRSAESRFALEMLASKLGIYDHVMTMVNEMAAHKATLLRER